MKHVSRRLTSSPFARAALAVLSVLCMAPSNCGGGGGGLGIETYVAASPTTQVLSAANVTAIVNQAVNAADELGEPATVAVVDRVGNVLAVAQMAGAPTTATISSGTGAVGGLEGTVVPTTLAAISKAMTAAYLSSDGNAFSTRTANQIIQQHFPVGVAGNPGGPLFGVQFSQLACSDMLKAIQGSAATQGPHFAPLGFAADSGGLPLYISGVIVGGIGVMSTGSYSLNTAPEPLGPTVDEAIALSGENGFDPPAVIEAPNIFVNGVSLDFIGPSVAPATSGAVPAPLPTFPAIPGIYAGGATEATAIIGGQQYGTTGSGIVADNSLPAAKQSYANFPAVNAYVLYNAGTGGNLFPPTAGTSPAVGAITAAEAQALIGNALSVALVTRAGIRIPLNTNAEVSASVVDLDGNILAIARSPDAPIFGIDVSLQKARSAVFFSRNDAMNAYTEINAITAPPVAPSSPGNTFSYYMTAESVADPGLFNSGTAFSVIAIGNLARPFYPDGQDGQPNGPLSLPAGNWSVFSTGLQVDLVHFDLEHALGGGAAPPQGCGFGGAGPPAGLPTNSNHITQLANGLQIFSGGFPIFRGSTLVGALGISGDGIQQDALIAYIGIQGDASINVTGVPTVNNAPAGIRADTVTVDGTNLVYVTCPVAPFLTSREETPCD
jgi:uncharacterized protein GlcG (DUF336 family)